MSTLFAVLLVTHVITGIVGVVATYATLLVLQKATVVKRTFLLRSLVACLSYFTSWVSGGYYYWFYYGDNVKPIIKAGQYPWAHNVVMEVKEHIFLLLPVLSFVTVLIAWSSTDCLNSNPRLKTAVTYLVATTTVIAILVALGGIIITGGAR